ncbi:MAG: AAA family ATPase [bacterium]|nr:AAA family ATPase [bacterium]
MKKLPIGIQTFEKIISGDYLYVDKTRDIHRLISGGGQYYLLSRPRRFGKSLLISTLKEFFSGNKELFKGLWIYDQIDWAGMAGPVVHIDFSKINYKTPEILEDSLAKTIRKIGREFDIFLEETGNYKDVFVELIERLGKTHPVVILIDEYDKPIIDKIEQKENETAGGNRDVLKEFYAVIKACDQYNRFVFITGISKFSKVSVFSALNNLTDITMDHRFSTLMGYTRDELRHYFRPWLEQSGEEKEREQLVERLESWYNGYSWDGKHFVCNPFSILHYFREGRFGNYWFETGTPSILTRLIREFDIDVPALERYRAGKAIFSSFDVERMHVVALLFQTGYLTLKEIEHVDDKTSLYILSYPNIEVKESFLEYLLGDYSSRFPDEISVIMVEIRKRLLAGEIEAFIGILESLFARIPHDTFIKDREAYYSTVVFLVLKLIGINIDSEVETNLGRIDAVIETEHRVFVLEFKMGGAAAAMAQIKKKKYYQKYLSAPGGVTLVGIGFDTKKRNIGDYKIEEC